MGKEGPPEGELLVWRRQWWKVCWVTPGDGYKFYRKLYARKPKTEENEKKEESPAELQSDDDSGCDLEEYTWVPSGLPPDQVRVYFSGIPEDKVPYVNSVGERYRLHQLIQQFPPQDNEPHYCHNLTEEEKKELNIFSAKRMKEFLGRGVVRAVTSCSPCKNCTEIISVGDLCVVAQRVGMKVVWHPACFVCTICKELLMDLIYFYDNDELYCGRHHAETFKPRCSACDELILTEECTEAEGRAWHVHHFACLKCEKQLGGQHYIMKDDRPCCLQCFDAMFTEQCSTCGEAIKFNDGQMSYEKQHWHATEKCFCCYTCSSSLLGHPFLPRKGNIYCSALCFKGEPSSSDNNTPMCKELERESYRSSDNIGSKGSLQMKSVPALETDFSGFMGSPNPQLKSTSSPDNFRKNRDETLFETSQSFPLLTSRECGDFSFHKSYMRGLRSGTNIEENLSQDFNDKSRNILIMPHSVIDIKETKTIFQRSILKKYSSFVQNTSFDKKENVLFTSSKTNDFLQIELEKSRLGYESEYFSPVNDQSPSSFEYVEQTFPKKQLKVRFQCIIPEIRYADSISRPQDYMQDNSDTDSSCSTCSSSSGEDVSTYKLPQRRDYGGIRISYVPNDAMACAKRNQEAYSNLSVKKSPNDKHCIIS